MRKGLSKYLPLIKRSLRNRPKFCVALVLATLTIFLAAGFSVISWLSPIQDSRPDGFGFLQQPYLNSFGRLPSLALPHRQVFPYSVVPGGVNSPQEIKEAVARDPVVAKHYSGLHLKKLRLIRLRKGRTAYVSYRLGGNIYWTKRKLKLAQGESLFTDGKNTVRTRCGNLISESPRSPTLPAEPTSARFDAPLIPEPPENPVPPLVLLPGPGGSVFFPPLVPIFPGGGSSPPPNHPPEPPPPPPVHIAEPSTMVLLLCGLTLLWVTSKFRNI